MLSPALGVTPDRQSLPTCAATSLGLMVEERHILLQTRCDLIMQIRAASRACPHRVMHLLGLYQLSD